MIKDKYYNDRSVDYNGNDLTINVGSFLVNGDLVVSGNIVGSAQSGIDLNTDSTLYITGNSDWHFDNDGNDILIFNDLYKKFSVGYDVASRSITFDSSFQNNPTFFFSGTSDSNDYGYGTGSNYIAYFENYNNEAGVSGIKINLNRSMTLLSSTSKFLSFNGFNGTSLEECGYISGITNDEGVALSSLKNVNVSAVETLTLSGSSIVFDSENVIIANRGSQVGLPIEGVDTISESGWFFPNIKKISFYDNSAIFDCLTGLNYPDDRSLGISPASGIDYMRYSKKLPITASNSRVLGASIMWGQSASHDLVSRTDVGIGSEDWFPMSAALGTDLGSGCGWKLRRDSDDYYYIDIYINRDLLMTNDSDFSQQIHNDYGDIAFCFIDIMVTVEYRDL